MRDCLSTLFGLWRDAVDVVPYEPEITKGEIQTLLSRMGDGEILFLPCFVAWKTAQF